LRVRPGDHICALYLGPAERDEILMPYLRAGLRAGEKCLCLINDADPSEVIASIDESLDVEGCVASHQLEVMRSEDAYLRSGRFSPGQMIDFLGEAMARATRDGPYRIARVVGEMTWVLAGPPGADELFVYESELNRFAPQYSQVLMCLYDLQRFGGSILVDLLTTHPRLLLGGMVLDNPHYLSPDEFRASRR
jgi:hypothetical protein